MQKVQSYKDEGLRMALQREGERIRMPKGLTADVMAQIGVGDSQAGKRTSRRTAYWWMAVAAAVAIAAFVIIVPQVKESREMARYEGSYVEEGGHRVEDYRLIKSDIREALSMADQAEALGKEK